MASDNENNGRATTRRGRVWAVLRSMSIAAAALIALTVLAAAALPLWMPWALRPAAERFGLEFEDYERAGYSRFVLHDISIARDGFSLSIDRLESYQPLAWAGRVVSDRLGEADFVTVSGWRLAITGAEASEGANSSEFMPYKIFSQVEDRLPSILRWLPRAALTDGRIDLRGTRIDVPGVWLHRGMLRASAEAAPSGREAGLELEADFSDPSRPYLRSVISPYQAVFTAGLGRHEGMLRIDGELSMEDNRLHFFASFAPGRRLPAAAGLRSDRLVIPGRLLGLEGYEQAEGSMDVLWEDDSYDIEVSFLAHPYDGHAFLPPVRTGISGHGDLERIVVERLNIDMVWLTAFLDSPLELSYSGRMLNESPVALNFDIDLEKQSYMEAAGAISGVIELLPEADTFPHITARIKAEDIRALDARIGRLHVGAKLDWPVNDSHSGMPVRFAMPFLDMEVSAGDVEAYGYVVETLKAKAGFRHPELEFDTLEVALDDGTKLQGKMVFNVENESISDGRLAGELMGRTFERYLPEGFGFERVHVTAEFSGPLDDIAHRAELGVLSLSANHLIPGDLQLAFRGRALKSDEWRMRWENDDGGVIEAGGALSGSAAGAELEVQRLDFTHDGEMLLKLADPVALRARTGSAREGMDEAIPDDWELWMSPLRLRGEGRALNIGETVLRARSGAAAVEIEGLCTGLLSKYMAPSFPDIAVPLLELNSRWEDGGPLVFDLQVQLALRLAGRELTADATLSSGDGVIRLSGAVLSDEKGRIFTAEGVIPAAIYPSQPQEPIRIDPGGGLRLDVRSDPSAPIWEELGAIAGFRISDPQLTVVMEGTISRPHGSVSVTVGRLEFDRESDLNIPAIERIEIGVAIDRDRALVKPFRFHVEGQQAPVEAEAELLLGAGFWRPLLEERDLPDPGILSGRFVLDEAGLEPVARIFPGILSAGGTLTIVFDVEGGRFSDGRLTLEGASTRPLMPGGALRDLRADVRFEGRRAVIEELSANLGGERIRAGGAVELGADMTFRYELELSGSNVPLVRRPGLVVRSDIDLTARGTGLEDARITGRIRLRESMMVSDWRSLTPQISPASPQRRPPFFSIEQQPFSGWEIDVKIDGDEFLSVRAPIFQGRFSADMRLRGTLLEPISTGDLRIDSGVIRFPFSALEVESGMISITEDEPFTPRLNVVASSRTYGYDIQMHLHGSAYDPVLEFSSHPPLSSQAILLMLTAGELPRDDVVFTGRQKATKLAFFIARNLLGELGGNGDLAQRLTIRTGENISDQGRETYYLEYMLLPRLGVVGEYDRFDAFNFGLKWRFFVR